MVLSQLLICFFSFYGLPLYNFLFFIFMDSIFALQFSFISFSFVLPPNSVTLGIMQGCQKRIFDTARKIQNKLGS